MSEESQDPTSATEPIEFTNGDAEALYNSCLDVQRLSFTLQMEIQLSKLITKLKKWVTPIIDSRTKFAKDKGFILSGGQYLYGDGWTEKDKTEKLAELNAAFMEVSLTKFEHWEELKPLLPMPLFTEEKLKDRPFLEGMNKQYFIQYCLKTS